MQKLFTRALALWLPFVVALTGVFGFIYMAVQQNYRQSLNDPQIQMAEDAATSLADNYVLTNIIPADAKPKDITKSLAPWIAVYDASGTPIAATVTLDDQPIRLPQGIFDPTTWVLQKSYLIDHMQETRFTWQPRPDIRHAVVLVGFGGPNGTEYVAVGRSMRLVEDRITDLTQLAAVAWSVTSLATLVALFILLALGWL